MFTNVDNSLSTRQAPRGARVVVVGDDLRRGPGNVASCTLFVGTGGNVEVETADGDTVTFMNVANGTHLPIQVRQVVSLAGGAANVIALY
jgi:hypothetical protein